MAVFQEKNKKRWTKDGRKWYFKCYYSDLQGNKVCKKSKMFAKQSEAKEEERKFLQAVRLQIPTTKMNFKELIELYKAFQETHVKITTYDVIKKKLKNLEYLNNIYLNDFNINHFNVWKKEINKKNLSTTYKNNIYKTLRAIMNHGVKYYDLSFLNNILHKMTGFTNPNELKKEMLFFTYEEYSKFILQEEDIKFKAYFETLYFCGLRKGEANALNWNDINFEKQTININKNVSLKIKGEKYKILPTKTKGSNRILPIPNKLLNDLKLLKTEYEQYSNFELSWFVFGGVYPLADTTVQVHKNNNCKLANVKKIRIHDFRHSCASLLINNGASINLVAKYLGHNDISTTLNTYSHMFKNEFDDIMKIMNNL